MSTGITEVKQAFQDERKPVTTAEFMEFWKSLSDEEKDAYKAEALAR